MCVFPSSSRVMGLGRASGSREHRSDGRGQEKGKGKQKGKGKGKGKGMGRR